MPRHILSARHYQPRGHRTRLLAQNSAPKLRRAFKQAFQHARKMVPTKDIARLIRAGRLKIIGNRIDWTHLREVYKEPFHVIGNIFVESAQLGSRDITAGFTRAGRTVRYGAFGTHRRARRFSSRNLIVRKSANSNDHDRTDGSGRSNEVRYERLDKAVGDRFAFDRFDEDTQDLIRQYQDELIVELEQEARDAIESTVMYGVQNGMDAEEIAAALRDSISLTDRQATAVANFRRLLEERDPAALDRALRDASFDSAVQSAIETDTDLAETEVDAMVTAYAENYIDYRAKTIADTESHRASNIGLREAYTQAVDRGALPEAAITRTWLLDLDERTCEICLSIPDQNPEGVGLNEPFDSIDGPIDDAPVHPSCVPAGTFVSSGSGIAAVSSRWHDGQLVVIRTASGKQFSGTINHPILTQRGWVGLGFLNHGDHVVRRLAAERLAGGMDDENMPTAIEQIAGTALKSGKMATREVPLSAEDFHGDAANGDIAIISAYRRLRRKRHFSAAQHAVHDFFQRSMRSPICFSGGGNLATVLLGMSAAAHSIMGGANLSLSSSHIHLRPFQLFSLAVSPRLYANRQKDASHRRATEAQLVCNLLLGSTGPVELDQVTDINVCAFRGHVLNLQTGAGHYTANGLISHNCRCSTEYVTNLDMLPEE